MIITHYNACYVIKLIRSAVASGSTYTSYEIEHVSGRGHGTMGLYHVQNVLWKQTS